MFQYWKPEEKKTPLEAVREKFEAAARGGYKLHLKTDTFEGAYYVLSHDTYYADVLGKLSMTVRYLDLLECWPIKDSVAVNKMLDYMLYGEGANSVA